MGEEKEVRSSASSFTSELFGSKESSMSSTGIFGSIFAPPPKVLNRESLGSAVNRKKQDVSNDAGSLKPGVPDDDSKISEQESQSKPSEDVSSIYQEQRVQPCHLSSSIFYGGQDVYSNPHHDVHSVPQGTQNAGLSSTFKNDGTEDDSGSASRGNWWQGSLYY